MSNSRLADRVQAILDDENIRDGLFRLAGEKCQRDDRDLDISDWGMFVGLAYGIARGEDPYEGAGSVLVRAEEAARQVHARYNAVPSVTA